MLVNMKGMLSDAAKGGYAVGGFNFASLESGMGAVRASEELGIPFVLEHAPAHEEYCPFDVAAPIMVQLAKAAKTPVAAHLDHGDSVELCMKALKCGFSSVMFDGSHFPFEKNIEITREVVDYAHKYGVVVEAELGTLAGVEDDVNVSAEDSSYTNPEDVEEFVNKTGVDSLAIAIGTSHGAYKFKPGTKPQLRFDILDEVTKRLPGFPIVLHGASSVPQEYVKIINANGGALQDAIGVPEDQLRQAARSAVCKINIDSDLRLGMTAGVREVFVKDPSVFDPRGYLKAGRQNVKDIVAHKIKDVLGSTGASSTLEKR